MDHSKPNNTANSCVSPSLRPRANHHTLHWRVGQELPLPGEVKLPGSHRCPHEHYCSCKTHLQQCPTDPMTLSFSGGFFSFLLQTGCHGCFSFKPSIAHLNWCKEGGKEKQSPFMHNSKQPPTQKTAQAWSLHLKRSALYELPSPTPISMVITVFYFDLFISAF